MEGALNSWWSWSSAPRGLWLTVPAHGEGGGLGKGVLLEFWAATIQMQGAGFCSPGRGEEMVSS